MHRRGCTVRRSDPATQPGQRDCSVRYSAYDVRIDPNDSILSIAERLSKYGGGGTNCALPLEAANVLHRERKFAGVVLVSDNESWVGTGRHGSTGVMTAWETFVAHQRKLAGSDGGSEAGLHRPPAVPNGPGL